jgi:hypothetical protein
MGFWDNLWSGGGAATASRPEISIAGLERLAETHDVRVMEEGYILAAPRTTYAPLGQEFGTSSPSPWTSFNRAEYNSKLQGFFGLQKYDQMRKSDGTIRGSLRALKIPALTGQWFVEPAAPGYQSEDDIELYKEQADWIWCNLTQHMSISWHQVLVEALLMCDFGYYMFEKVWENKVIAGELRTVLTKLGPRHPMDVKAWQFDAHGGPLRAIMYPSGASFGSLDIPIDIEKLLVFSFDREAGNVEGTSMLRSVYKHWYFKEQLYKIDAIQKERHGIGIPVIKLPVGYKPADKTIADELGRNIRTNERAHITRPPGWEIEMLKLEGQLTNAMDSIEHHNDSIREAFLTHFIPDGAREDDLVMYFKAARTIADILCEVFNLYLIPQMIEYNWPGTDYYPKLKVRRIGETADWRTLSFAIRNLIGAGALIPDRPLEDLLRQEMDMPPVDEATSRIIATPQNPYDINEDVDDPGDVPGSSDNVGTGQGDDETHNTNSPNYNRRSRRRGGRRQSGQIAGLPRQSVVGRQKSVFGLPRGNTGNDRSGG